MAVFALMLEIAKDWQHKHNFNLCLDNRPPNRSNLRETQVPIALKRAAINNRVSWVRPG